MPIGARACRRSISVTSDMTGVAPQMLRIYEARGLVSPERTPGGTRRYSGNDVAVARRAADLSGEGINLAAVRRILALEAELAALHTKIDALRAQPAARPTRNRRQPPPQSPASPAVAGGRSPMRRD
jgi:DNA-binding transcriptional MerR regulator